MPSSDRFAVSGVDYVDLYQIHRFDLRRPIEETLEALHRRRRGAVRRATSGASSMSPGNLPKRCAVRPSRHGWTRFVSMQNHYNLVYREEEREMLPLCREEGIRVIPWSPLARGFLAGNRAQRRLREHLRAKHRRVRAPTVLCRQRLRGRRSASSMLAARARREARR